MKKFKDFCDKPITFGFALKWSAFWTALVAVLEVAFFWSYIVDWAGEKLDDIRNLMVKDTEEDSEA